MPRFSIITVCLNPDEVMFSATMNSIKKQTYEDFEVIVKDGGSKVTPVLPQDSRFKLVTSEDAGIYDAMNQAVSLATGDFCIFINAGDKLYDENVLYGVAGKLLGIRAGKLIAYGDSFFEKNESVYKSPSSITPGVCYRNIPNHQAIFYSRDTLVSRGFDQKYKVRGDYEHFLYTYFETDTKFMYLDMIVSSYEGGGFSESKANKTRDKEEYREIVRLYVPTGVRVKNRAELILTLHTVRKYLATNPKTAKGYQKLISRLK